MEKILWLYAQPHDSLYPVVCLDERPCFLIGDVVEPLAMQTGQYARSVTLMPSWVHAPCSPPSNP